MHKTTPQIFLCFDFGLRRIGTAIGQMITKTATPLQTLAALDGDPEWKLIEKIIKTWHVEGLIVGLPYNMDGTEQPITQKARDFAKKLELFQLPIYFMDERLTTREAKRQLSEKKLKKVDNIDSIAAAIILESWFASQ